MLDQSDEVAEPLVQLHDQEAVEAEPLRPAGSLDAVVIASGPGCTGGGNLIHRMATREAPV